MFSQDVFHYNLKIDTTRCSRIKADAIFEKPACHSVSLVMWLFVIVELHSRAIWVNSEINQRLCYQHNCQHCHYARAVVDLWLSLQLPDRLIGALSLPLTIKILQLLNDKKKKAS